MNIFRAMLLVVVGAVAATSLADQLFDPATYKSYVADHRARMVGDSVTLLIFENSSAASDADSGGDKSLGAGVNVSSTNLVEFGSLDMDFNEAGSRATQRSGRLRAQLTAVVESIDEVGRLQLSGVQEIIVNGEKQVIKIKGWIRPIDIGPNNTVVSTRLSDASIEYKGDHLEGLSGRGGIISRLGDVIMWAPKKAIDLTEWLLGVL